ncbi:hypothetical protein PMAYCL1PPCAC_32515 [Pristionchus mayeri]|uniref:Uncharacterized protein n=1 Tax=Pristionchus mayeri TaxID=1317129 RepID=A0AAN5DHI4_9BILA|nr:hypothetical protein PMAYCL1PPCAC_32515 [Pristionchus mayeri]
MTIRYANPSTLPSPSGVIDFNMFIPHASSMHILIKIAMRWTAETPTEEGRKALLELLMHGIARFGKGTPTENDEAMLPIYRMLVRHSRSLVSRGLLYSRLYDEKCYRSSAVFYRDWIEALASEGSEVDSVIELAKLNEAAPKKMLDKCISRLDENSLELRERIMTVLGDINNDIHAIVRDADAPASPTNFTPDELNFVLSSSKMSEVLLYLSAALAPPECLHLISQRIGAIRVVAYEVDAEEAK